MIYRHFIKIAMSPERNATRMNPSNKSIQLPGFIKRLGRTIKRYSYENPSAPVPTSKSQPVSIPQASTATSTKAAPSARSRYGKAAGVAAGAYIGYKAFKHFREKKREREQAAAQANQPLTKSAQKSPGDKLEHIARKMHADMMYRPDRIMRPGRLERLDRVTKGRMQQIDARRRAINAVKKGAVAGAAYAGYSAIKHYRKKKQEREQAAATQANQPLTKSAAYKLDPTSRMRRLATVLKKHKEGSPMYDKVMARGREYAGAYMEQRRGPLQQTMSVGRNNAQRQVATLFKNPGARKKSLVPLPTTGRFGAGHEVAKQKRDNATSQAKHVGSWVSSLMP